MSAAKGSTPLLKRILALSFFFFCLSTGSVAQDLVHAKILSVRNTNDTGWRNVDCEALIRGGRFEGRTVPVAVHVYGHRQFDPDLNPGDAVVLQITEEPDSNVISATFMQYRVWPLLAALSIGFAAAVGFTAGPAGLRGLAGTAVSVVVLVGAMALSLRVGVSPILTVIGSGLLVGLASMAFLFHRQPRARQLAMGSLSCSFIANSILAVVLVKFLKLEGSSLEGARDLLLGVHTNLTHLDRDQFWQILAASLPIATLGAVFDSAVVLSVSLDELAKAGKSTPEALRQSTLDIGRDLFTTLFLTLFFAHLGLFAPLWVVAFQTDTPILFLLNSEWISVGLAHVTASAAGLVFSVLAVRAFAPKVLCA